MMVLVGERMVPRKLLFRDAESEWERQSIRLHHLLS